MCVLLCATVWAEQRDFRKFSSGDVTLGYPDDWRQIPVPAPTIAAFTKGEDVSLTITRTYVEFPASINDAFVEYETQSLRKDHATATEFAATTITHRTLGEILQVDFNEARVSGRNSRAFHHRFLAIPAGNYVYRVAFVARADEFAKRHEPVYGKVIDSLIITPPPPKVLQ
jgi:hypothetical protein